MSSFRLINSRCCSVSKTWNLVRQRAIHTTSTVRAVAHQEEAAAQRAERTMTRFWKKAGIKEENDTVTVVLDHRNLRTPSKNIVKFPAKQRNLALLTAAEWDAQTQNLKAHSLPLTSVIARAMDGLDPSYADSENINDHPDKIRPAVVDKLLTYLDGDSVCYHETFPEIITQLQDKYYKPILEWTGKTFDVKINITTGLFSVQQPEDTKKKLRAIVESMDPLELAAFEKAVMSSKSFLIGLALVRRGITVEQAARAAHVEMNAQMDRWGEVEDSHDVEREYIRQTLGSVAIALMHKRY
ncbi:hypothetical protein BDF20DRAFT_843236 [Mycotypha africana]|uniref:uncharacterized protein n=1 Tax=Mycotypha africana TaxID=64632 RepID=UPI0022FFC922|nr:uncharacterized protein BDF20DRAFT_843236 [Mycotypha africana]KAI8991195.1 hypothetical protein BDF20DRAFT_843236 [Mycotypha africana]